jgi:hypothetical protein
VHMVTRLQVWGKFYSRASVYSSLQACVTAGQERSIITVSTFICTTVSHLTTSAQLLHAETAAISQ